MVLRRMGAKSNTRNHGSDLLPPMGGRARFDDDVNNVNKPRSPEIDYRAPGGQSASFTGITRFSIPVHNKDYEIRAYQNRSQSG
jgi:hypothetical protein